MTIDDVVYSHARLVKAVSKALLAELLESDVPETLLQQRYPRTAAALGKRTTIVEGARAVILRPEISLSEIALLRHRSE